jgi:hypothetical protein
LKVGKEWRTPEVSGAGDDDPGTSLAGTDTQRMLFHDPDGASGTVERSGAAGDDVDVAVDGDADAVGLVAGKGEGEPLAVAPRQPAVTKAVNATRAAHLRQPRPLTNTDFTACPSGRSTTMHRLL